MATHKEWREQNKDKCKLYAEASKPKRQERIYCECGAYVLKVNIVKHRQTEKHKDLMNKQTLP